MIRTPSIAPKMKVPTLAPDSEAAMVKGRTLLSAAAVAATPLDAAAVVVGVVVVAVVVVCDVVASMLVVVVPSVANSVVVDTNSVLCGCMHGHQISAGHMPLDQWDPLFIIRSGGLWLLSMHGGHPTRSSLILPKAGSSGGSKQYSYCAPFAAYS